MRRRRLEGSSEESWVRDETRVRCDALLPSAGICFRATVEEQEDSEMFLISSLDGGVGLRIRQLSSPLLHRTQFSYRTVCLDAAIAS